MISVKYQLVLRWNKAIPIHFFTMKPAGQGTGLGLSISHDIIVQQHRGEIKVETEEGEFTEFVGRLPKNG